MEMYEKINMEYIKTCCGCSQGSNYGKTKAPLEVIFNELLEPFEVIAMDIMCLIAPYKTR